MKANFGGIFQGHVLYYARAICYYCILSYSSIILLLYIISQYILYILRLVASNMHSIYYNILYYAPMLFLFCFSCPFDLITPPYLLLCMCMVSTAGSGVVGWMTGPSARLRMERASTLHLQAVAKGHVRVPIPLSTQKATRSSRRGSLVSSLFSSQISYATFETANVVLYLHRIPQHYAYNVRVVASIQSYLVVCTAVDSQEYAYYTRNTTRVLRVVSIVRARTRVYAYYYLEQFYSSIMYAYHVYNILCILRRTLQSSSYLFVKITVSRLKLELTLRSN